MNVCNTVLEPDSGAAEGYDGRCPGRALVQYNHKKESGSSKRCDQCITNHFDWTRILNEAPTIQKIPVLFDRHCLTQIA